MKYTDLNDIVKDLSGLTLDTEETIQDSKTGEKSRTVVDMSWKKLLKKIALATWKEISLSQEESWRMFTVASNLSLSDTLSVDLESEDITILKRLAKPYGTEVFGLVKTFLDKEDIKTVVEKNMEEENNA